MVRPGAYLRVEPLKVRVFVAGKPFYHNLLFVVRQGDYPRVEPLKGALALLTNIRLGFGKTFHDKHSSLLQTFANYRSIQCAKAVA